jgi:hypothetical protein
MNKMQARASNLGKHHAAKLSRDSLLTSRRSNTMQARRATLESTTLLSAQPRFFADTAPVSRR